ncbi:beta-lactamase family protein [Cellulosimicrobium terreum]|nr:beta-lactamase family protein [Cellulosimicrobium terreum]
MTDLEALARDAASAGIALHSVQMSVDGETVLDAGSAPLGPRTPHRMYSVAKTLTAFAVGILAGEGRIDLDDPVCAHFPGLGPGHPWLEQTTLRHMLEMRGPHAATRFRLHDGAWLDSYFEVPPTHPPGTAFTYDTSAAYVLAALVERVSGTTLADYLRPRLLDPLGISHDLRFRTGPDGYSHGGSGLVCRADDLFRLALLLLDGGVHEGRALLPADFLRDATTPHADTATLTWGTPFRGGYGYQLWLPEGGGQLMFGLGGQIVLADPEHRLALVVTADAQACQSGDQRLTDLVLTHLVAPVVGRGVVAGATPRHAVQEARPARRPAQDIAWPVPRHDAAHAHPVAGAYRATDPEAFLADLELDVHADGGRLGSPTGGWSVELAPGTTLAQPFGPQASEPRASEVQGRPAVVTAGWAAPRTLDVVCWLVDDELAVVRLRLHAGADGTLTVRGQGFGEGFEPRWTFVGAYVPDPAPGRAVSP